MTTSPHIFSSMLRKRYNISISSRCSWFRSSWGTRKTAGTWPTGSSKPTWSWSSRSLARFLVRIRAWSEPESWWWGPNLTVFTRSVPHNFGVDGTTDAVGEFRVQLGQCVPVEDAGFREITDSCSLNDVTNDKLLDSFILGTTSRAVGASDVTNVTSALLVTSSTSSLESHDVSLIPELQKS